MEPAPLKLMIPGPIQPAEDVLDAMGGPVQAHYGPAFTRTYNETLEMLRPVFGSRAATLFLMVGSGSAAIDAAIGSSLCDGDTILIGNNGFFGARLIRMAEEYNLNPVPVEAPWGEPLRAEDFRAALRRHPEAKAVAIVHLETSTTIVNPLAEIAAAAREHGALVIVDAVSSLGGLPMRMDEWGLDIVASATQKCLGAPPGLAPVAISPRAWEVIDQAPRKGHGWYLNLRTWREYATNWADWHPFPITMATSNLMALRQSLMHLLEEGVECRLERYTRLARYLRRGLRSIGYEPYTPDLWLAPVLTAAYGPRGVPTGKIVDALAEQYQIKISGGLGLLKDQIIRIGHMSPTVSETDLDEVVGALGSVKV